MQNLLAALERQDVEQRPFPHINKANVLPAALYDQLQACFPAPELIMAGRSNLQENAAMRLSGKTVLHHPQIATAWKGFFEEHVSARHWQRIVRLFGDVIRATHPGLEDHFDKPLEDFS